MMIAIWKSGASGFPDGMGTNLLGDRERRKECCDKFALQIFFTNFCSGTWQIHK